MNIADLFVTLGIKGSDKAVGELDKTKKGLKDVASMSLEAKAAIIGAAYALERLFSASGQKGMELNNFNALIGGGTQALQKYMYVAKGAGVSNQEMMGTFEHIQEMMTRTKLFGEAPAGLDEMMSTLQKAGKFDHEVGDEDIEDWIHHPENFFSKWQQYANIEKQNGREGLAGVTLGSMGASHNVKSALFENRFNDKALAAVPTLSESQVKSLAETRKAVADLESRLSLATDKFFANHGKEIADGIVPVIDKVSKLAEAFVKLGEDARVVGKIGAAFKAMSEAISGVTAGLGILHNAYSKDPNKQKSALKAVGDIGLAAEDAVPSMLSKLKTVIGGLITDALTAEKPTPEQEAHWQELIKSLGPTPETGGEPNLQIVPSPLMPNKDSITPPMAAAAGQPGPSALQGLEVNQTFNFTDGRDPKQVGAAANMGVTRAYNISPARANGG